MNALRTPTRAFGERNDNIQHRNTQKPKQKPPKPSSMCKTPPSLIQNLKGQSYTRGSCIGEGGFARCFQVNRRGDGTAYAAKTIAKATLKSEKTKTKLLAEIKIHRALKHSNIVHFVDCFEDDVNVYILLEMCSNQSLLDMVRARQTLTETEARFYMVQLLGAINYMHTRLVIHRDLKLGNVFIDDEMNLKIGDFGLAARLENERQRRYTICGTPNYIAPELLIGNHEHTFTTDIWALGVILYAMLFNKPPFQESDVNVIYERIKRGDLRFPANHRASCEAVELIRMMLAPNPASRPSVSQILEHDWFKNEFPASIPQNALQKPPVFNISPGDSQRNFVAGKIASGLVMKQPNQPSIEPVTKADISDDNHVLPATLSPPSTRDKYRVVMVNNSEQQQHPHNSPIVNRNRRSERDSYQQQQQQRQERENQFPQSKGVPAVRTSTTQDPSSNNPRFVDQQRRRPRPLSTLVGGVSSTSAAASSAASLAMRSTKDDLRRTNTLGRHQSAGAHTSSQGSAGSAGSSHGRFIADRKRDIGGTINYSLQKIFRNLIDYITAFNNGTLQPRYAEHINKPVYLTKWADFTEIWGLAYGLNDGAIGMKFRDETTIRYDPLHKSSVYYSPSSSSKGMVYAQAVPREVPAELVKKLEAVSFSHNYMEERLGHSSSADRPRFDTSDGVYVEKFVRHPQYMMFILSDGAVQFNFSDHHKLVIFNKGEHVHIITAQREEKTMSLSDCVVHSNDFAAIGITTKLEEIVKVVGTMTSQ